MFDLANKASVCHLRVAGEHRGLRHSAHCPLLDEVISLMYRRCQKNVCVAQTSGARMLHHLVRHIIVNMK